MRKLIAFIFPVYSWGHAVVLAMLLLLVALIALFSDPVMALYMGVGGYLGIVINQARLGAAPDEMEIQEHEVGPVVAKIEASPYLVRLEDRLWAPRRYRSWWWASDRISIVARPNGNYLLRARRNDLKLLRAVLGRGR